MSNIKLRTAAGGSVTLTPENVTGDVTLTVPGDNSTLVSAADLSASTGAGGVGYLPAGTGAVATTVQDVLRDFVSIYRYMTAAKIADAQSGAPTLDHTQSLLDAIDAANAIGVRVKLFDGDVYLVSPISTDRAHFVCDGIATIKAKAGAYPAATSVITSSDIWLDGVSVDGANQTSRVVTAIGKFRHMRGAITNALGTATAFGRLVYATSTCTHFEISPECEYSGVSGVENGIEGDTSGADCGLYIESNNFKIKGPKFTNIGGYEDGDCIRVQLLADADLLWTSAAGSYIEDCKFPEIKKRAIKLQASHVRVSGNEVTSSATDALLCPYAGIDIYGSHNKVIHNKVKMSRAVAGIIDNGKRNKIDDNDVKVSIETAYTTARTSATSLIRNEASEGSVVSNNKASGKTSYDYFANNAVGTVHSENERYGAATSNQVSIYINGGSYNKQFGNKIAGTSTEKLRYGIQCDNTLYNDAKGNSFEQMYAAIRYFGTTQVSKNSGNIIGAGVSNVIDYTGVVAVNAQTIADSDGSIAVSITPGAIAAQSTYSQDVSWPPVAVGVVLSVNPASSNNPLESGLLLSVEPKSAGVATIKIHNITAAAITPATRTYKIRLPA